MVKYKRTYLTYFGYGEQDYIPCEFCLSNAVDIHHLIFKSQNGTNEISNLMALCRNCHNKAHSSKSFNNQLIVIHERFIDNNTN